MTCWLLAQKAEAVLQFLLEWAMVTLAENNYNSLSRREVPERIRSSLDRQLEDYLLVTFTSLDFTLLCKEYYFRRENHEGELYNCYYLGISVISCETKAFVNTSATFFDGYKVESS